MDSRDGAIFEQSAAFVVRSLKRNGIRRIGFTSARAGAGTTTTVLGVAGVLARTHGLKVLVIELDLAAPRFTELLALDKSRALSNAEQLSAPDVLIQQVPAGFDVIAASSRGNVASMESGRLASELTALGEGHDLVLVDAPPILNRPGVLAALAVVDAVVLVVEAGRTRFEILEHIKDLLEIEDTPLQAAVLTKRRHPIPEWVYGLLQ